MSQTDDYILRVNGSQAQAELNKTREASMNLGGGLAHVEKGLDALSGRAGTEAKKALGSLQFAMGGVSGEAAGLVNAAGDIIGALGSPWSLAFIAAGAAVTGLASAWQEMEKEAKEATDAALKHAQDLADGTAKIREEIAKLRADLRPGPRDAIEAGERAAEPVMREIELAQARIAAIRREYFDVHAEGYEKSRIEGLKEIAVLEENIELLRVRAGLVAQRAMETFVAPTDSPAVVRAGSRPASAPGVDPNEREAERARREQEALDRAEERSLAAQQRQQEASDRAYEREVAAAQKAEEAITDATRKAAEERAEIARREHEATLASYRGYTAEATSIVVGASQQLIEAAVTGQEHAAEAFAASVLANAGNAMIGHGIDAFSGGVAQAALTGGVAGGPAIATGLGLIAGGVALGGTAAGINHIVGGGTIGSPIADKGRTERGIHEGSSRKGNLRDAKNGSGRPMQGTVIINNYGVAGPLADDQARALERAQQRLARRADIR